MIMIIEACMRAYIEQISLLDILDQNSLSINLILSRPITFSALNSTF